MNELGDIGDADQTIAAGALLSGYTTPVNKPDKSAPAAIVWSASLSWSLLHNSSREIQTRARLRVIPYTYYGN